MRERSIRSHIRRLRQQHKWCLVPDENGVRCGKPAFARAMCLSPHYRIFRQRCKANPDVKPNQIADEMLHPRPPEWTYENPEGEAELMAAANEEQECRN